MTKKKTKRPKPEVGQTLYVTVSGFMSCGDNIYEYIVTRVNTTSFYAHNKDDDDGYERRFNLKTLKYNSGIGETYNAHLTKEEILKSQAFFKEKRELKEYVSRNIHKLTRDQLRTVKEMIDSK